MAGEAPGWARASVDMGPVRLGPDQPQDFEDRRVRTVDVGNPHLVLCGPDVASVDVAVLGPQLAVRLRGRDQRGVDQRDFGRRWGTTRLPGVRAWRGRDAGLRDGAAWPRPPRLGRGACSTGGGPVRVRNPGGTLEVTLGAGENDPAFLAGPVRKVADIDIHPGMLS